MKNQGFKLCYIDAFAGSGRIEVRGQGETIGSAVRALEYSFDRYIFIEKEKVYADQLALIGKKYPHRRIKIHRGDCNEFFGQLNSFKWYKHYWRGIIFLDPYAMNLKWESLQAIAKTRAFDLWYLFPLSALLRVLRRDGKIDEKSKQKIHELLGTSTWEQDLYIESSQLNLFDEQELVREPVDGIVQFIIQRLQEVFPAVSQTPKILRQPRNNSPLFLLCFAGSNQSKSAIDLSLRAADHILKQAGDL